MGGHSLLRAQDKHKGSEKPGKGATEDPYKHAKYLISKFSALITHSFIHSFIQAISIAPLQVHYYSETLPTQHEYCAGVSR